MIKIAAGTMSGPRVTISPAKPPVKPKPSTCPPNVVQHDSLQTKTSVFISERIMALQHNLSVTGSPNTLPLVPRRHSAESPSCKPIQDSRHLNPKPIPPPKCTRINKVNQGAKKSNSGERGLDKPCCNRFNSDQGNGTKDQGSVFRTSSCGENKKVENGATELGNGELVDVDEWSPVEMLRRQIRDSEEMPMVDFDSIPEKKLVKLLSLYDAEVDTARIHFVAQWNNKVNAVLEHARLSTSSDINRNVASLTLSKLDSDILTTGRCLTNERARRIIEKYTDILEQRNHKQDHTYGYDPKLWQEVVANLIFTALETNEQKCQICWDEFAPNEIFGMSCCQCVVCSACMRDYFHLMIHDGYVADFVCPVCHSPDIDDDTPHFQLLETKLKSLLDESDYKAYEQKMIEWNLMKNPDFQWCINATCCNGFLISGNKRSVCSACHTVMCSECRKPWEEQHDGLTCEKFEDWKSLNDPHFQAEGLAQQLQENGIDCPRCRRRYILSKGGCIHFTCTFCHYEFCSACSGPFLRTCKRSKPCKQSGGLHCHHPRNCLYYLRDRGIKELQKLLKDSSLSYDANTPKGITHCTVLEEKSNDNGNFTIEQCKKRVEAEQSGLCETHYKEYLAGIVYKNGVDPASMMSEGELIRELENHEAQDIPKKHMIETAEKFRSRLAKHVMDVCQLKPRQVTQRQKNPTPSGNQR